MDQREEQWNAMCDRCIAAIHGDDPVSIMLRADFEYSKNSPFVLASDDHGIEVCRRGVEEMIAALNASGFEIVRRAR